jgi:hypothetical protein
MAKVKSATHTYVCYVVQKAGLQLLAAVQDIVIHTAAGLSPPLKLYLF